MSGPLRRALAFALLASASCGGAQAAAAGAAAPSSAVRPAAPDAHVRNFYAWYLGALRAGGRPFADDAGLKAYLSASEITALRAHAPAGFDPVLGLPEPRSDWIGMKVAVGKPSFHHEAGQYDAYVDVRYSGFVDPRSHRTRGTDFVGIVDQWTLGLTRTKAGWRIASFGASE